MLLSGEARNGYQASSVGLLRLQKLFELLEQGKIARGIFLLHLAEHGACTLKRAVARFGMSWTGSGGCHADEEALGAPEPFPQQEAPTTKRAFPTDPRQEHNGGVVATGHHRVARCGRRNRLLLIGSVAV